MVRTPVEIRPLDPLAHRDALFHVYCESLGVSPSSAAAREWRDVILPRHTTRADFALRAAVDDGRIVGFGDGYTGGYGQWWTDRVAAEMRPEIKSAWLDPPHFEVVQLHVLPSAQRGGIGARPLDALLEAQPNDRALLSMDPRSPSAGPFYRKQGWRSISTWADEAGDMVVLGKDRLR